MKGLFKLIGMIFTFQLGAIVAMLFAQRSGKALRKDLKKSENPLETLFKEGLKVDKEILGNLQNWAENSESVKEMMAQIDDMKGQAKDMTDEAKAAAADLKKKATKKATTTKKTVKKKATKAKKTATKKATATKKKVTKKATTARKTARKAVKKAVKKS